MKHGARFDAPGSTGFVFIVDIVVNLQLPTKQNVCYVACNGVFLKCM